ncbi:C39 family peptidase [Brevundimonas sp.]|uniref:C39 family peptidase n=1 Tax=Brevundimonas sp. TaxID=1871086 RepID=UPI002617EAB5|nr:C39 family peptidase [Brevundimonas sp.]
MRRAFGALALVTAWCPFMLSGCVAANVNPDRATFAAAPSLNAIPHAMVQLESGHTLVLDLRLDRQVSGNGCGAHAVASMIDYWHRAAPRSDGFRPPTGAWIYAATPPSQSSGYALGELVELLETSGLVAVPVETTVAALKGELDRGRPAIARVSLSAGHVLGTRLIPVELAYLAATETFLTDAAARLVEPFAPSRLMHFWVVIGYDAEHVIVLDPALGIRAVQSAAFARAFDRGGNLAVVVGGWA